MHRSLSIEDPLLPAALGRLIREARILIGWSQAELAGRAGTSQSTITRLERSRSADPNVAVVARVLAALGLRGSVEIGDRALDDRRRQRDAVHARIADAVVRRLERLGWSVRTEVPFGHPTPRGWVDLVAVRDDDGLITEVKGDIPDVGGMQRQVTVYSAVAGPVFASLGWQPRRIATLVVALDSAAVAATIAGSRSLLATTLPGSPQQMTAWLEHGGAMPPRPTMALIDPTSRRREWLLRTPLSGRRSAPAYRDYADAAEHLSPRLGRAPPHVPPRATRSRPR